MIRTDLVPHPYFNVKSPEFYKKQKAQFELSQSKFKLVNSIRSGQQQELLQNQIEEIKRKQKALNDLTKLQETLEFQLDDQNPRVYGNTAQQAVAPAVEAVAPAPAVGAEQAPAGKPAVAVAPEEKPLALEAMNVSKLKDNFRDEFGEFLIGKSAWVNKLTRDKLIRYTAELRKLPQGERDDYMTDLEVSTKEEFRKTASVKSRTETSSPLKRPVFNPAEFKKGKSGLKKGTERKQKPKPASKKPLSMLEQLQKSGPFLERMRNVGEEEEETEGFGLKKKKTRGKGISKKQKKVLLYGSAVAGNNNSKLLDKIMGI
jgi:hypothetical protein